MKSYLPTCVALISMFVANGVLAEDLPASAKKASMDEFKAFSNGKKVNVEIFDQKSPVKAVLVWDWDKKTITGTAVIDGKKKIQVKNTMKVEGDKACAVYKTEKTCHTIYIDQNKFYEITDSGAVHAISTLTP